MAAIRTIIRGREQVIKNIGMKQSQIKEESVQSINNSIKILFQKVSFNISRTCHDLADLAAMGHPYARDHILNPHSPYYQVHMQSADMRRALTSDTAIGTKEIRGGVGFTGEAEESLKARASDYSYLRAVVLGTRLMIQRDFLNGSLDEVRGAVEKRLVQDLSKATQRKI